MLVGHFAPALLLKRAAPDVPLWALCAATQAVDFLFFGLVFAGIEAGELRPGEAPRFVVAHGIWSHSLAMTLLWTALPWVVLGALGRGRQGAVLAAAVGSHLLGDLLVHAPDLPLAFDQTRALGLGLWRFPALASALECGLLVAAAAWLDRARRLPRKALARFTGALVALQLASDFLIPLPPDDVALGISAVALYVGVAWAALRLEHGPRRA